MDRALRTLTIMFLLATLSVAGPTPPAIAAGTVGDGTPESCTEAALETALGGGGMVTFDCGAAPHTISLTGLRLISVDTQIDGGGLITLDGQGQAQIFSVSSGITLALQNITLSNGSANNGAAIYNGGGTVEITNSMLKDSSALFNGGAIFNNDGTVEITNSTISGNLADGSGGGIYNLDGVLTITGSTLIGNSALVQGGAIVNSSGTVEITNSMLSNNSAGADGGGLYNALGMAEIDNGTLDGNTAGGDGGGLFSVAGSVAITNSTLTDNEADADGGGIANDLGLLTIDNSTIRENASSTSGGGVYGVGGVIEITNGTLSNNTAPYGGGISLRSSAGPITQPPLNGLAGIDSNILGDTLIITNSTLNNNSATDEGDGIYNVGGTIQLAASIIASSDPSSGANNCDGGDIISLGGNLSDDATCNLTQPSDQPNTDPLLGPLDDNGGATQTHLPQPGSPAIDAGPCVTDEDQRGIQRPQGSACDIGSVEVRTSTYSLCVNASTGAISSSLYGSGCGAGQIEVVPPGNLTFCINSWTGQVAYTFGRPCAPPRITHTLPDDGDLLTCVNRWTGANRWVRSASQCTAYELPNLIPASL